MNDPLLQRLTEIGAPTDVCELAARYVKAAMQDPLTGLLNRRGFDDALRHLLGMSKRYHRHFSLVLFDLDSLKLINDRHGHQTGDKALRTLAKTLQEQSRDADVVCRIGGDEFAALLPETNEPGAQRYAQRISIHLHNTSERDGWTTPLSVSSGIAQGPSASILADADRALLGNKRTRRL